MCTPAFLIAAAVLSAEPPSASRPVSSGVERRLVKSFDFNEAPLGNFEPVPMNWSMHRGSGYPRYLEARFDADVGHAAPPSMVLKLLGGSVAAVYQGQEIAAHPASDYQLSAWIRTQGLHHARARLSIFFVDRAMQKIDGTERSSEPLGGDGEAPAWRHVVIDLPGGAAEARWVGLSFAVEQPGAAEAAQRTPRPIRFEDVHGAAWVDDITIVRLPRAWIDPQGVSHLLDADRPVVLRVFMDDGGSRGLSAELTVRDADGRTAARRHWDRWQAGAEAARVELPELKAGWYEAEFVARNEGQELLRRETVFARLAPPLDGERGAAGPVGVLLNPGDSANWENTRDLLRQLGVSAVKVPVWSAATNPSQQAELSRFMHQLRASSVGIIGFLSEPPAGLAAKYDPSRRALLDILSEPEAGWRPWVEELVARHGPTVAAWQLGRDGDERLLRDARWTAASDKLRACIESFSGEPTMVAPWNALLELSPDRRKAAILSLTVPSAARPDEIPGQLGLFAAYGFGARWATLQMLDAARYGARAALADLAKRIVLSRVAGMQRVFAPQPWFERQDLRGPHQLPRPEFSVLRTMGEALANVGTPEPLSRDADVAVWLLPRGDGSGTVIAWRDSADGPDPVLPFEYGAKAAQYDLFGSRMETATAEFRVGFVPTIITPAEAGMLRLQASVRLANPRMAPLRAMQDNAFVLRNSQDIALRGRVNIETPPGWRIEPSSFDVSLPPGSERSVALSMQMPVNEPVGRRVLQATLTLESQLPRRFVLGVPLDIDASDLYVEAITQSAGNHLIVRQRVTNRTREVLNLRGFLVAPERPVLARLISRLGPGETAVNVFQLSDPLALVGHTLRVSLEQIDGPRRHNLLVPIQ